MIEKILFLVGIIAVVIFLKDLVDRNRYKEKKKSLYQYKKKDFLITRPEHEFFSVLVEVVGDRYYIFTQVHLPTILKHDIPNGQNWKGAFSHINGKSVDFVICDKAYIKPLLAIELDDKSHERPDRIERDSEVERMLKDAGMPLLRFENHGSFDKEEIKSTIQKVLTI